MADFLKIVHEVRQEFQIPPFFQNEGLLNYAKEGNDYFARLNPDCDFDSDLTYRALLKNYIYYAYYHRLSEFFENYNESILNWQLTTEVKSNVE